MAKNQNTDGIHGTTATPQPQEAVLKDVTTLAYIYLKTEFTQLSSTGNLISIALLSERNGTMFYAEFTDYWRTACSDFVLQNVLPKLLYHGADKGRHRTNMGERKPDGKIAYSIEMKGTTDEIRKDLIRWLKNEQAVIQNDNKLHVQLKIIGDVCAYDWVFLMDLLGDDNPVDFSDDGWGKILSYIPYDLSTLMSTYCLNPDTNREDFAGKENIEEVVSKLSGCDDRDRFSRYNALYDAYVLALCYNKLINAHYDIVHDANGM